MRAVEFLAGWMIRSSILIAGSALLLWLLRAKDSSVRSAAWTTVLCGSLVIPALTLTLPKTFLPTFRPTPARVVALPAEVPALVSTPPRDVAPMPHRASTVPQHSARTVRAETLPSHPFDWPGDWVSDWPRCVLFLYAAICGVMLLRLFSGLQACSRLQGRTSATGEKTEGIEIRASGELTAPVTLGILRATIVLPADWREWDGMTLAAVLAHEYSHIQRHDLWVQLLSGIHRALLWANPLSWFLHRRIVQSAEEACDDAALAAVNDRVSYAQMLIDFMRRGVTKSSLAGVSMARYYGDPQKRIRRVLNSTALSRGVTVRSVAVIVALASPLAYVIGTAQGRPQFDVADVHPSSPNTMAEMRVHFAHGRYELLNATLVDLIRTAWSVDPDDVTGGPDFLDTRRFDVIATASVNTTQDILHAMLRQMLKERFQLTLHSGEKDRPAYAITVNKKAELQPADGSETAGCDQRPGQPSLRPGVPAQPLTFDCRNLTMAAFSKALPAIRPASGYVYNHPILDHTGLSGAWNFSLRWTPRDMYFPGPVAGEPISLFDAFEKQLGLKLTLIKVREPVIVVDSVNEMPTPNPPGIAQEPALRPEFEVADIKQDPDLPECSAVGVRRGGEVDIHMTVRGLIGEAWGDMNHHRIVGLPKSNGPCWAIRAKAPAERDAAAGWVGPVWNGVDIDTMRQMMRSLLADRFKLATHHEQRAIPGYALVAGKPKLRKADPANRPGCREGPGADGKDPRLTNPMASRLITCRNVTLMQFVTELNDLMYGQLPVVDATGIAGRYDMTINFSPPSALQDAVAPDANGNLTASEPNGAISIFDAVSRQLGLELRSRNVTTGVLVIDHVEETPTDN